MGVRYINKYNNKKKLKPIISLKYFFIIIFINIHFIYNLQFRKSRGQCLHNSIFPTIFQGKTGLIKSVQ